VAHILIIHPDFAFRRALTDTLEELCFAVFNVARAEDGVNAVRSRTCSVVIIGGLNDSQRLVDTITAASPRTECIVLGKGEDEIGAHVRHINGRLGDAGLFLDLVRLAHERYRTGIDSGGHIARYESLISAVPDAVCLVDVETATIVDANEAFLNLYGMRRRDLRKRNYASISVFADRELSALLETPEYPARPVAGTHRRFDGTEFPVSVTARVNEIDERSTLCVVIRNKSEEVAAEAKLTEANKRLRGVIEGITHGFIVIDDGLRVVYGNRVAISHFGSGAAGAADATEVTGNELLVAFPRLAPTMLGSYISEVRASRKAVSIEIASETDGEERWYHTTLSPFDDNIAIFLQEITTRKQMELRLRQTQRLEAVGRLAGGVAHDFNNLLTVILGYTDMIRETAGLDPEIAEGIEEIKSSAERATTLTQQLLAFSRRQVLQPITVDANELLGSFEKMIRRLIGEDVRLTYTLTDASLPVRVDPIQFEQVVLNLAINARDAMPTGGRLTVETELVEIGEEEIGPEAIMRTGPYVEIRVTDTGCGMEAEVIDHIFEPFFTTKSRDKGTGLGLSTAYGIVKQSGGYLFARSEPDQGSVFRILLPVSEIRSSKADDQTDAVPETRHEGSILIVEDEEPLRAITARMLSNIGYSVVDAADGESAIEMVCSGTVPKLDLVITDVVMPGISGRQMIERIRERHPGVKVLFMSGYTDDEVLMRGVSANGEAFLPKPFSSKSLATAIRTLLEGARPE
jgi:two-component system, cell cycle sensor histidine kinase and response regulator CckA